MTQLLEDAARGGKGQSNDDSSRQPRQAPSSAVKSTLNAHFAAMKKRKPTDKRTELFWRLLCIVVVFCRLPFSIVESSVFRAFVWFCDATLPFPTRSKLNNQLLPKLRKEIALGIHRGLKGVRGVAVSFDLWMSRKTEDNLSFDIHYITDDWRWQHKHVGILSCSDSSIGSDIAAKLQPAITEFGLSDKIFSIVKDGGGNLSTASRTLTDNNMVRCSALGRQSPYETICFAHKINNACNATVKVAKDNTKQVISNYHVVVLHFVQ
jgi:hypothetical protein